MSLKVSRVLHAGYIFEYEGVRLLFDPLFESPFSRNCFSFPPVQFDTILIQELKFDALFISHYHDDHCSFDSLNLINRETPIYIYCLHEEMILWLQEFGFKNVFQLRLNATISVGAFEVTPYRALDANVDSIFHIRAGELNILNVVDSWIDDETMQRLSKVSGWDLVLWPFQTMRELEVLSPLRALPADPNIPHEWVSQLEVLNPRFLVPSSCQFKFESWSWYNEAFFPISYKAFAQQVLSFLKETEVRRFDPGEVFTLAKKSLEKVGQLDWVLKQNTVETDYVYSDKVKPTSTSEISKHLPALNDEQKKHVTDFFSFDILHRYHMLDILKEGFFKSEVCWKLSIYDENGFSTDYFYTLSGSKIKINDRQTSERLWTTEVPAYTLFRALEEGESLTSMYIRINNQRLNGAVEDELQSADLMEDPLVRSLFTGIFGSYQLAQFERLKPV